MQHMNTDIRTKLQHHMNLNANDYVTAFRISLDEVRATDVDLMATASLMGYDIAVYTKFGHSVQ